MNNFFRNKRYKGLEMAFLFTLNFQQHMRGNTFQKTRKAFFMVLVLVCIINSNAQSEKSYLTKIAELKSNPDFSSKNPTYIDLLIELARENIRSNSDSTFILLKEGFELSKASKYRKGECNALATYGYYFSDQGEMEKAYEYNVNALEIANLYNLDRQKVLTLNNMGNDFGYQGNYANALTQYLEALEIAKKIKDIEMMSLLNANIADLYNENGDYETALTFHEIGKQLSIELNDQELRAQILLNMSVIYTLKEDLETADNMVNECIEIFKAKNRMDWLSHAYEQKGNITLKQNNYKKALDWFVKSKILCDKMNFGIGYMGTYKGLAESYLGLQKLDSAEMYALKGLQISKELNISTGIKESNLILSKIYHESGQDIKAYKYLTEYRILYEKGSIEKFKIGLDVFRSEMNFENQKKILIEENNKIITKQKVYIYISIAVAAVLLLFLLLFLRTNKLQNKYNYNLQTKQKILLLREAELNDSNKTKDKLFSIIAHDLKGPIDSFYLLMKMYMNDAITKEESDNLFPKALEKIQGISDMLNNLLIWAKSQLKGVVITPEIIDVTKMVNNIILLLTPMAEKKEIRIINRIPENTFSLSDRNTVNIVVRNLLNNSIKFTNLNGEISINLTKKETELQIEVKDNGIGMNLETQASLVEHKSTQSTYGTNNEKGTGLGLALCIDLVEKNGGKLWVSSVKNVGTIVYFTIPK